MSKRGDTRERILDIAEAAILQKGFGATSIEEIIAEANITKSGFFYHFSDKNALARALFHRYLERDAEELDTIFGRARELTDDPLQVLLVGLKLMAEMMGSLPDTHPGCLVATYCYHERLFDAEVVRLNTENVLGWRRRFADMIRDVNRVHPPREPVEPETLADMIFTTVEGGIILSKVLKNPKLLPNQVMLARTTLKMLYEPAVPVAINRPTAAAAE